MQQVFFILGIVGIALFVVCAALAALVFFKYRIRDVYLDLTGKKRMSEIEERRKNVDHGKGTGLLRRGSGDSRGGTDSTGDPTAATGDQSRRLSGSVSSSDLSTVSVSEEDMETSIMQQEGSVDAQQDEEEMETSVLAEDSEEEAATSVIAEVSEEDAATSVLSQAAPADSAAPKAKAKKSFGKKANAKEEDAPTLFDAPKEEKPAPAPEAEKSGFVVVRVEMGFSAEKMIDINGTEVAIPSE